MQYSCIPCTQQALDVIWLGQPRKVPRGKKAMKVQEQSVWLKSSQD